VAWTKKQLIQQAFEDAGLASFAFDLTPEQWNSALRRLDSMMATWAGQGIALGYALSVDADGSDLDNDSGIPATATEAVYLNLAPRIAGAFGKAVPPATVIAAKQAYDALVIQFAKPIPVQFPSTLPRGAGNARSRLYGRTYFPPPDVSPIQPGEGGSLSFGD
jgi:hypothetical protein